MNRIFNDETFVGCLAWTIVFIVLVLGIAYYVR